MSSEERKLVILWLRKRSSSPLFLSLFMEKAGAIWITACSLMRGLYEHWVQLFLKPLVCYCQSCRKKFPKSLIPVSRLPWVAFLKERNKSPLQQSLQVGDGASRGGSGWVWPKSSLCRRRGSWQALHQRTLQLKIWAHKLCKYLKVCKQFQ